LPLLQPVGRAVLGALGPSLRDAVAAIACEFSADAASIWLRESNDAVRCVFHDPGRLPSTQPSAAFKDEYPVAEISSLYSLAQTARPFALRDCASNPLLRQAWEWFSARHVGTTLVIPIPGPAPEDVQATGWCLLFHQESREFSSADLDRAALRGHQLSLAIQVARAAAEEKGTAIAAERKRIARELHDTLAQGFTAILLQIENAKALLPGQAEAALAPLDHARDLARESLAEARRAIWTMRPRALDESDLPTALKGLVRQMAAGSGVTTEFTTRGSIRALTVETETNLLRIIQEAVTNALRHARARVIRVHLNFAEESVKVSVEDDGHGFSQRDARNAGGFGLIGMRERAETLSGKLLISTHPARGTRILVKIPIPKS
jgi:signal transduction histidine kinase